MNQYIQKPPHLWYTNTKQLFVIFVMENIMTNLDITTYRLCIKTLNENYADIVAYFLKKNKEFFEPYEAAKRPIYYTHLYQKMCLQKTLSLTKGSSFEL